MKVSREESLADSLVAIGFPPDPEFALPANMSVAKALAPKVRNLRAGARLHFTLHMWQQADSAHTPKLDSILGISLQGPCWFKNPGNRDGYAGQSISFSGSVYCSKQWPNS